MGRIVLIEGTSKISKKIQENTNSPWSHCGYMIGPTAFIDFRHDRKDIKTLDSLVDNPKVRNYVIVEDGAGFMFTPHIIEQQIFHYNHAKYAKHAILKLAHKLKKGRDQENIHRQISKDYTMTCASMIMYNLTGHGCRFPKDIIDFPYHYSQAVPNDFYESCYLVGKKVE